MIGLLFLLFSLTRINWQSYYIQGEGVEDSTELDSNKLDNYLLQAEISIKAGDLEKGLKYLEQAVDKVPSSFRARELKATVNYYLKNYQAALNDYEKLLEFDTVQFKIYRQMATTYMALKDYEQAIEKFNLAIDENDLVDESELVKSYGNLGVAKKHLVKYQKAKEAFKKALAIDNRDLFATNNLGLIYLELGDLSQAKKSFKRALELDDQAVNAYGGLGRLYLEQERLDKSIKNLKEAVALRPNYASSYYYLAKAYQKQNEFQKAGDNYRKAMVLGQQRAKDNLAKLKDELIKQEAELIKAGESDYVTETDQIEIDNWLYQDDNLYYQTVEERLPLIFYPKPEKRTDESKTQYQARLIYELKREIISYGI